jgi:ABC-2 type transport system ATP-binding protein
LTAQSGTAIDVHNLTKHYVLPEKELIAVNHICFQVHRGEIFGFLGPNGAGKTTTIRMLTGLTSPSAGNASVLGLDIARSMPQIKKRIGVVPEQSNLYSELTAFDNLLFSMELYGVPRAERSQRAEGLLERFRLTDKRLMRFGTLSRGMKRALTVAASLAHRPEVLFLDEPTTGLDVASAQNLRRIIAELREEGVTVFLTTHYLEEAERLCDRIALLVKGSIVTVDTVTGLKAQVQTATAVSVTLESAAGERITRRVTGEDVADIVRQTLAQVESEGGKVLEVNTVSPTLHDAFMQLTGLSSDVMRDKPAPGNQGSGN